MKSLIVFILLGLNALLSPAIKDIRISYSKAPENEDVCKKLIADLSSYTEKNNPLFAGYRACATMIMGKHSFNPATKLGKFNEGKELLEKCISADAQNIELRFLRFAVQTKAPSFLKYNQGIESDKNLMLSSLPKLNDADLKKRIVTFLSASDKLTPAEKQKLSSL